MNRFLIAAAIVCLALLTFFKFPGHTWLQSDTQIYAPILEHLRDPSVLSRDMLVVRPHVSFTIYDEMALAMRKLTGLQFREVLALEQILTRALGIWGFYLMAGALRLGPALSLLVAAVLSLGATVVGPSVLTLEYEPVPRGFSVALLYLAIGLVAQGRDLAAGVAGAAAFLIHPPTVYPFWAIYFLLVLWPAKPDIMRRRLMALFPLLCAVVVLLIASRHQAGVGETQMFFTRVSPELEKLQRMRASYVWVSMWGRDWLPHYLALLALTLAGYWRLKQRTSVDFRFFLLGLPAVGMLSMPLSYLLLEKMKWALIPQFQPMRALLFVIVTAVFVSASAAMQALESGRYAEALAWLVPVYLIPANTRVLALPPLNRAAAVVLMCVLACMGGWAYARKKPFGVASMLAAAASGFFIIPGLGAVQNYPALHQPELAQLARWARNSTPADAVFFFPEAGRDLAPGIFRAESLRAVYVDWKGGGQVNYLPELGEQWWRRWREATSGPVDPERYRQLGIDYIVLSPNRRLAGRRPIFENARFVVYSTRHPT